MAIIFMRHGEAASSSQDPPLSLRGREQAARVAHLVAQSGLRPTRIVHSGLRRAAETAHELARAYPTPPPLTADSRLQPDEEATLWVSLVGDDSEDIGIVSHQPFLTRLCGLLLSGHEALAPVEFRTATAAILALKDSSWILERVIHAPR